MLQGELDWIVMRAMEKDRTRRYETANGLAADLGRYMADQPVLARPPSKWYSFRKSVRRNKGLFASVAAVAAAMVLGLGGMTTGFLRAQRERDHAIAAHQSELVERDHAQQSERERRLQLVDSLKSAAPHGVPMIVESLQASPEQVLPVLRRRFDDKTAPDTERLRTACALSALGEPPIEFLIDAMPTAPAAESANLIRALGAGGRAVVVALASKSSAESDAPTRVRYASTLLSLGDPAPAAGSLAAGPDPGMRTAFIAGFASWHGDLQPALGLLKSTRDPDVRSGLCAAIGSVDPASLSATERQEAQTLLSQLFRDAPDGGTHGAAGWALRHWRIAEPEIAPSNEPPRGRDWFANPHGMTFVRMNPGTFRMGASPGKIVLLTNGFFICDRETSIADFNKFIDDASVPDSDKPRDWPGPDKSVGVTPECPVQNVNYFDMILYCNWLSQREGRKPCYSTEDGASGNWKCDLTASGYRLPTGAEWEYACRGGAQTQFPFGDDGRYIQAYANIAETTYDPCGSRLPNAWGLFDMLGSAWELCWEHNDGPPAAMNVNPIRSPMDGRGTMYGGAFHGGTFYAHPSSHANINLDTRAASNGFRLVCADSASPSTQPTLPTIERLLDKAATQPATRPLTP
jgi:formylglycine-generating enzyme required for sulfatase activity